MRRIDLPAAFQGPMAIGPFLSLHLPGLSEEDIRQVLWQGSVWQGNQRIRNWDSIPDFSRNAPAITVWKTLYPIVEYTLDPSLIVHEDEWFIVVWKPADLNTCQSVYSDLDCLTWGIAKYLAASGSPHDPSTINRLDRDTQGLVLYGKSKAIEKKLYRYFMDRDIHKRYLAVCPDVPDVPKSLHVRDTFEYQGKVQDAETRLRRLGIHGGSQYWLALPVTGRTHQIRRHFQRYLAALDGDRVYGGREGPFLKLACIGYRMRHPATGQPFRITRWPEGF